MKAWKKYAFEFLCIFVAVVAAFALDKWNSDRKDARAEEKILNEILVGLRKDKADITVNMEGHRGGLHAITFWRRAIAGDSIIQDSVALRLLQLTRDFIAIQNTTGYRSLSSRGLELLQDDSLRSDIIGLYEYDLAVLAKLEEHYGEMQFFPLYGTLFQELFASSLLFTETGRVSGVRVPMELSEHDRKRVMLAFWKMTNDRHFVLREYERLENRVDAVIAHIERVLAER